MSTFTKIGAGVVIVLVLNSRSSYHMGKHGPTPRSKAAIAGPGISGEAYLTNLH